MSARKSSSKTVTDLPPDVLLKINKLQQIIPPDAKVTATYTEHTGRTHNSCELKIQCVWPSKSNSEEVLEELAVKVWRYLATKRTNTVNTSILMTKIKRESWYNESPVREEFEKRCISCGSTDRRRLYCSNCGSLFDKWIKQQDPDSETFEAKLNKKRRNYEGLLKQQGYYKHISSLALSISTGRH